MSEQKQMRFSDDELKLLKSAFDGNEALLKLMRKVFLPEYDPNAPLGQAIDLWMTLDLRNMPAEQQLIRIQARNELIMHIEQQLIQLQFLAGTKDETPATKAERQKKDSAK